MILLLVRGPFGLGRITDASQAAAMVDETSKTIVEFR